MASSPMQTGCLYAVGSGVYVFFFWIPARRRDSGTIGLKLRPSSTSLAWRCASREYSLPSVFRDSNQGFKDRPLSERSIDISRRGSCDLCPVAAVLNYMVQRGSAPGPFFRFANGNYLTRERFVTAMRTALAAAGINPSHYAGHSFRIGAATIAAQQGIQDSLIKTLGRWESSAYTVYIRTPRETLCAVSGLLAKSK